MLVEIYVTGIEDSPGIFTKDIIYAGRGTNNPHHVHYLTEAARPSAHTSLYVASSATSAAVSAAVMDDEEASVAQWLKEELGAQHISTYS